MTGREFTNIGKPPIEVEHGSLQPASDLANRFASVCPACKIGTLLVRRHRETLRLERDDYCALCGQWVIYSDIEDLRRKDGFK